jgi:UDP:flavonoid glycosyltransferase YjiC (YdhE family)
MVSRSCAVTTSGGSAPLAMVLPLMRDQFEMARRIVHHRLGVEGSLADLDAEKLGAMIGKAVVDRSFKARVTAMRRRFEESDRSSIGVEVIEATLAERRGGRAAAGASSRR